MNPFRPQDYREHRRFEHANNQEDLQQQQQREQQQQQLEAFELQRQLLAVQQLQQHLHQRDYRAGQLEQLDREQHDDREQMQREPLLPARQHGGNMTVRLRRPNQINIERFMLSMRIILQRQSVHFDIGGGDGILVWSWRRPTLATGQLGQGDGDTPERLALRQVLPTNL